MATSTTCYKVGDYAYFETNNNLPFAIRRIEELIKGANGIDARVMCFYRRREIPTTLLQLADKHQSIFDEDEADGSEFSFQNKYQLKLKELFLSRQYETLPVSKIRGRCTVYLLHETEDLTSYLQKEDTFFYSLVYEPHQKTLLADRGEIRVGPRFQAETNTIPLLTTTTTDSTSFEPSSSCIINDGRNMADLETLIWDPYQSSSLLTDAQIDQFLLIARSVGTFARALDTAHAVLKQPSLHLSVACASRDITTLWAMDTLHEAGYDIARAVESLVPSTGPVLCRDEMESWSTAEANMFEESLEKYGKDFVDIRRDFFPWKSLKSIVEYYYMWKTTDRYVQQRRLKVLEEEKRLKQITLPNKITSAQPIDANLIAKPCESCQCIQSDLWYLWGMNANNPARICESCWIFWKKHGGLRQPIEGERQGLATQLTSDLQYPCTECNKVFHRQERLFAHMSAHRPYKCNVPGCDKEFKLKNMLARHIATSHTSPTGLAALAGLHGNGTSSPPYPRIILKTKAAFYLKTTPLTKMSRKLCKKNLKLRHLARHPFSLINTQAVKHECIEKLNELNAHHQSMNQRLYSKLLQNSGSSMVPGTNIIPSNTSSSIHDATLSLNNRSKLLAANDLLTNNNNGNQQGMVGHVIHHKPGTVHHLADGKTDGLITTTTKESNNSRKQDQPFQFLADTADNFKQHSLSINNRNNKRMFDENIINASDEITLAETKKARIQQANTTSTIPLYQSKNSMNIPQKRIVVLGGTEAPDDLFYKSNTLIRKMRKNINPYVIKKATRSIKTLIALP